ncbi:hypothetical protein CHUAL_002484 [Chamberlinius hualienensis]
MKIYCTICWDAVDFNTNPSVTKCGHLFHNSCILLWLKTGKNCPQCRTRINTKNGVIEKMYFETGLGERSNDAIVMLKSKIDSIETELRTALTENSEYKIKATKAKLDANKYSKLRRKYLDIEEKCAMLQNSLLAESKEKKELSRKLRDYKRQAKSPSESANEGTGKNWSSMQSGYELVQCLQKQIELLNTENSTLRLRIKHLSSMLVRRIYNEYPSKNIGVDAAKRRKFVGGSFSSPVESPRPSTSSRDSANSRSEDDDLKTPTRVTRKLHEKSKRKLSK